MRLAVIGLGRMGANISRRLLRANHEVVGFNRNQERVRELSSDGLIGANSLEAAAANLSAPRILWVPAAPHCLASLAKEAGMSRSAFQPIQKLAPNVSFRSIPATMAAFNARLRFAASPRAAARRRIAGRYACELGS